LLAKDPFTAKGAAPDSIRKIPFPVDALGYPLSGNAVWNACIRNQVQLDADGQPFSCSRYHVDHLWTHPDLLIEFTWRSEEKILILPEGFETVVVEEEIPVEETAEEKVSSEKEETEDIEGFNDVSEEGNTADPIPKGTDAHDEGEAASEIPTDDAVEQGQDQAESVPTTEDGDSPEDTVEESSAPAEEVPVTE
jgi:hypothetical protein